MKRNKDIINKIKKEAQKYFKGASGCHDWSHVERVYTLAMQIGKIERANLGVLEIACYLHDIGRKEEMDSKGKICHAEKSAQLAGKILSKYKIDEKDKRNIINAIICHRYRNRHLPKTLEAKVLFDADKLDSIGAVGLARAFLFAGRAGSNSLYTGNEKKLAKSGKDYTFTQEDSAMLEYEVKLKKMRSRMLTQAGKRMAKGRDDFMKLYLKQFWQEVDGKK
jgi:uncharacterized protein